MNKFLKFFSLIFILQHFGVSAQPFVQDQVLRVGYRLGTENFNGAYRTYTMVNTMGQYVLDEEFNDKISLSNYEIWYGRFSEHVFYEANLDGMVNAIVNFGANKSLEYDWMFSDFKKTASNGVTPISAIDYDILNMKLAFGGKGIYGGFQYKLSRVGTFGEYDPLTAGTLKMPIGFTFSEDNIRAVGLGVHANLAFGKLVMQNHLMFNWCKGSNSDILYFQGKEIDFESTICFGKGLGLYATPFFKKRFSSQSQVYDRYGSGIYSGFNGSTTIGIKLGFYFASEGDEEDVYITIAD
ncbi:MAG: hypothetical protein V4667_10925 [Bacteroidota bacterium]